MFREHVESFTAKHSPQYVIDYVQGMLASGQSTKKDFEKEVDRIQKKMDNGTKNTVEWLGDWSMRDYLKEILKFYKE